MNLTFHERIAKVYQSSMTSTWKSILAAAAHHIDCYHRWPRRGKLAEMTSYNPVTVGRVIKDLAESGVLYRTESSDNLKEFDINWNAIQSPYIPEAEDKLSSALGGLQQNLQEIQSLLDNLKANHESFNR